MIGRVWLPLQFVSLWKDIIFLGDVASPHVTGPARIKYRLNFFLTQAHQVIFHEIS